MRPKQWDQFQSRWRLFHCLYTWDLPICFLGYFPCIYKRIIDFIFGRGLFDHQDIPVMQNKFSGLQSWMISCMHASSTYVSTNPHSWVMIHISMYHRWLSSPAHLLSRLIFPVVCVGIVAVIDHYNHDWLKVSNDIRNLLSLVAFIVSLLLANRIRKVSNIGKSTERCQT